MQINNRYLIILIIVFISLFHNVSAQQRGDIIISLEETFIDHEDLFINKPINSVINNLAFPIKGYGIDLKLTPSIEDSKINAIKFYFLPKKNELENVLKGQITNTVSPEKVIVLTVYIKNYEKFPLAGNPFYNSTGDDNWNDSIKSMFLSSGIIVGGIELFSN